MAIHHGPRPLTVYEDFYSPLALLTPTSPPLQHHCPLCCFVLKNWLTILKNEWFMGPYYITSPPRTQQEGTMPSPLGSGHCGVKNPHQDSPSPSLTHSRPRPSTLLSPHGFQLSGTWFPIPGTDACPQMRARNVGTGLSKKAGERSLLSPHCPAAPKTILGTEELMPNTYCRRSVNAAAASRWSLTCADHQLSGSSMRASGKGGKPTEGQRSCRPWGADHRPARYTGSWCGRRGHGTWHGGHRTRQGDMVALGRPPTRGRL